MQINFFYFMRNAPQKIREKASEHIAFWKKNNYEYYFGGPSANRTVGIISFKAQSLEEAKAIIENDPFIINDLVYELCIKEWIPEK